MKLIIEQQKGSQAPAFAERKRKTTLCEVDPLRFLVHSGASISPNNRVNQAAKFDEDGHRCVNSTTSHGLVSAAQ
jgi:hypothetical protein